MPDNEDVEIDLPEGYSVEPFVEDDLAPEGALEDCDGGEYE